MDTAFVAAAQHYELRQWDGDVMLFRVKDLHFAHRTLDESYGWTDVVGGRFDLVEVPGNHETLILEPNVSIVAAALYGAIDRVLHRGDASGPTAA